MGRVWRAVDEMLDRLVAVKEMRIDGLDPEDTRTRRERTLREARATARIDHPHVVRVYDVVDEGEHLWIVMELVAGRSLERIMAEDGPLGPAETSRIGLGLVAALRQVHARGVLHRDIKPGNVLVETEAVRGRGRVVLTDFGIAAIQDAKALTMVGMLVGSPDYMAPERISGRPQGPPSDVWSLGATLCAALAGRSPFSRDTTLATLHAVLYEEPELPAVAGPLRPVLAALLQKDPSSRPDLDALETSLQRVASPPPTPTIPVTPAPTATPHPLPETKPGTPVPDPRIRGEVHDAVPAQQASAEQDPAPTRPEAGTAVAPLHGPTPPPDTAPTGPTTPGESLAPAPGTAPEPSPAPLPGAHTPTSPSDPPPAGTTAPGPSPADAADPGRPPTPRPGGPAPLPAPTPVGTADPDRPPAPSPSGPTPPASPPRAGRSDGDPLPAPRPGGTPPPAPGPTPVGTADRDRPPAPSPGGLTPPPSPPPGAATDRDPLPAQRPSGPTPSPLPGPAPAAAATPDPSPAGPAALNPSPAGPATLKASPAGTTDPGQRPAPSPGDPSPVSSPGSPVSSPGSPAPPLVPGPPPSGTTTPSLAPAGTATPGPPPGRTTGPDPSPAATSRSHTPSPPPPGVSLAHSEAATQRRVDNPLHESPRPRRRRIAVGVALAAVVVAGAVVAGVLLDGSGSSGGGRAAGPSGSASVSSSPTVEGTSRPQSLPPGAHREAGGFAWATPEGWKRDVKTGAEVHYTAPDGTQELAAKSSLARGDLMDSWEQSEQDARQGADYRKIRLERTTFRDHPAVVWEYSFTLQGEPWHARLLGFTVDGRSYQINTWYRPEAEEQALKTYGRVRDSFTVL